MGPDAQEVVQKTAVAFRRKKNFLVVTAPSAKRVELGLNLDATPPGDRVVAAKGMCTHKVVVTALEEVDADLEGWIRAAYERAG
jgi:predicted transport protein